MSNDTPSPERPKRPPRGERKLQILQTLAAMLEEPGGERVTTAALAGRLQVSEAALYRHFASKAQMFEGLIEFIEHSLFGLINQITSDQSQGTRQAALILQMLLGFAERNPGMTRVLIGDALVNEHARLQQRINQALDRLEMSLKQCFRVAISQGLLPPSEDPAVRADLAMGWVLGRWMRYAKGGFARKPQEASAGAIARLAGQ
ncbi:MAG: nucleoid occlusion factor SlmA [Burkholderiaceae bacterium]